MSELLDAVATHPIRLTSSDDLRRSRLTSFFRLLLAIPHALWIAVYGIGATLAWIAAWVMGLVKGEVPPGIHAFLAGYLRYRVYVSAYVSLAADPFPPFSGAPGAYPVTIEIDPPAPQGRLTILFRGLLAIPAFLISYGLNYLLEIVGFLGWLHCVAMGRQAPGIEKLLLYGLRYQTQMQAYAFLVTGKYPAL